MAVTNNLTNTFLYAGGFDWMVLDKKKAENLVLIKIFGLLWRFIWWGGGNTIEI